jgi:hypothetical protein
MLPPPWQSCLVQRVWKGWFLALLHEGLSEAVVLEMEPWPMILSVALEMYLSVPVGPHHWGLLLS